MIAPVLALVVTFLTPTSFHAASVSTYQAPFAGAEPHADVAETQTVGANGVQTGSSGDPVLNGQPASTMYLGGRWYLYVYRRWFVSQRHAIATMHFFSFESYYPRPALFAHGATHLLSENRDGIAYDVWSVKSTTGAVWTIWIDPHDHYVHESDIRYRTMDNGILYNIDRHVTYDSLGETVALAPPPAATSADGCMMFGTPQLTDTIPRPDYPPSAKKLKLGPVGVDVAAGVTSDGALASLSIAKSSGNSDIDQSALAAASHATFAPVAALCPGAWAMGTMHFDFENL